MPTAIKFAINQVHDRADRRRVERRRHELTAKYAAELGGMHTLGPSERVDVEVAGELVALVELGRDRIGATSEPGDPAALKRLEVFANKVLAKLELENLSEATVQ